MVTLGELGADEVEALVATTVASFIDDLVSSGLDRKAAETAVAAQMVRLLPNGVDSLGHRFRSIAGQGRTIGRLSTSTRSLGSSGQPIVVTPISRSENVPP